MQPAALRTERDTPDAINERILRETEQSIQHVLAQGPHAVEARLRELDHEWDTERTLESLAAGFALGSLFLGATVNRRWYALSGIVAGFLFQHAVQGWCPPLPLIRAMGVRTPREIDAERFALKLARGDFQQEPYIEAERFTDPGTHDIETLRFRELPIASSDVLASVAT